MRLDITGRHVDITPALRQLIDKRLVRLGKLLNDSAISAQVILTKEKYRLQSEIVVHARGDRTLRGRGEGTTWRGARSARPRSRSSSRRRRSKASGRSASAAPPSPRAVADADAGEPRRPGPRIVRASRYAVKPMSIEDAALQVDARPESFVVFRNAETDAVSILYKRKDGNLGLIEPD